MQWHPLFAKMLRAIVQDHYKVETNVPVGDAPRSADIVLLRKTSDQPSPFRGLWRLLTTWNILEFKGRSVSARVRDLDLLVELGLGIDRRLNQERVTNRLRPLDPLESSFWYIVNHLGKRFLHEASLRLGNLVQEGPGVWRSQVLRRPLFLIDGQSVPVEHDSVPLHLAGEESSLTDHALAEVIVEEPGFWELFAPLLRTLHPKVWKEAATMAKSKKKRGDLDLSPLLEDLGLEKYLAIVPVKDIVETVGPKKLVKELGMKRYLSTLSADERRHLRELLKAETFES